MLKLYQSNRLEYLADLLAELTGVPLSNPLAPEIVVVPHPGMGRWLSLRLAERTGVCANTRFPLPAGFIWEMLDVLLGPLPAQDRFSPGVMQWVLYSLLGAVRGDRRFQPVDRYLSGTGDPGRYELSLQLARCFDQYLVYRPEWIEHWEHGRSATAGDAWQGELWRRLSRQLGGTHWVELRRQADRILETGGSRTHKLPERISLFAVHTLSPGYLGILEKLARRIDLHLYLLNPCEMDWSGIMNPAAIAARELEGGGEDLYFESGNPLLGSWGRQGRDFLGALLACDPGSIELFADPGADSMLHRVQEDILHLRDGSAGPPRLPESDDHSIQVHSCHTPMREVEVLRDQLLDLLRCHDDLMPEDILVMAPELDQYAPYIDAVFAARPAAQRIPYSIADQSLPAENPLIGAFLRLPEISRGRYPGDEILSLLEIPAIQHRFGITEGDLPIIGRWVRESGIRWGRDGAARRELGLPGHDCNTWQAGLDRMLLGYALPAGEARLFRGCLPYDQVEGSDSSLLGALGTFVEALFSLSELLGGRHAMPVWEQRLLALLDRFFEPSEEDQRAVQALRSALAAMTANAALAGLEESLPLEVVQRQLSRQLSSTAAGSGFLTSGVTFCALTPMRSLPFQVICLLGMNDGSFPRDPQPPGFDLMLGDFRAGDRPRRLDDRYLFLETLVSARRRLHISYIGQDVHENSTMPPSVFVSELVDYLSRSFTLEPRHRFPIRHPLQPFHPDYFRVGSALFSYASDMLPAACASLAPSLPDPVFITRALSEPEEEWRQVELEHLVRFYANPTRYLLGERLGMVIERSGGVIETRDPFGLDRFQLEHIGGHLLEAELDVPVESARDIYAIHRAAGRLPHGEVGRQRFLKLQQEAREMGPELRRVISAAPVEPQAVDLVFGNFRVSGRLSSLRESGIAEFGFNKLPPGRRLGVWIRHLVLNLIPEAGIPARTTWLARGERVRFPPVPEARALLEELLEIYWQGLQMPLHLFPRSSSAYTECLLQGREEAVCLARARAVWLGDGFTFSERDTDPYYRLAFPRAEVLDSSFQALSQRVFEPLLSAMEVG